MTSDEQNAVEKRYYNQPTPQLFEQRYNAPVEPKNPVLRGLALYYSASVDASPFLQVYQFPNSFHQSLVGRNYIQIPLVKRGLYCSSQPP